MQYDFAFGYLDQCEVYVILNSIKSNILEYEKYFPDKIVFSGLNPNNKNMLT